MDQARQGIFFALVGPGGAGKTTLLKRGLEQISELTQLATATTRQPRPGETHGVERYFLSEAEFIQSIRSNELYEYEEVHRGTYYGTPRRDIDAALHAGSDLIADIDAKGAFYLKIALPDHLFTIFIAPPDASALRERLEGRGDENTATQARMERFFWEMSFVDLCDVTIINDTIEGAVASLQQIVERARSRRMAMQSIPSYVSLIPLRDGQIYLTRGEQLPLVAPLRLRELPHQAIQRMRETQLIWQGAAGCLSPGQVAAPEFIPILNVEAEANAIHFQYWLALVADAIIPSDWQAHPVERAPISPELKRAIKARAHSALVK
ncbi:MAG: guanylate kinase [Anaerolineaceae bacterium]|nr:guanylate kinase [Anaerolineaceae bacterium]